MNAGQASIRPYDGTVTIRFSDAVVAASHRALVVADGKGEGTFFIPFDDIYFEFLQKSNSTRRDPERGTVSYWSVHAVGEAADDVMWVYETPEPDWEKLHAHGAFASDKVDVEATPSPDPAHSTELPG